MSFVFLLFIKEENGENEWNQKSKDGNHDRFILTSILRDCLIIGCFFYYETIVFVFKLFFIAIWTDTNKIVHYFSMNYSYNYIFGIIIAVLNRRLLLLMLLIIIVRMKYFDYKLSVHGLYSVLYVTAMAIVVGVVGMITAGISKDVSIHIGLLAEGIMGIALLLLFTNKNLYDKYGQQ